MKKSPLRLFFFVDGYTLKKVNEFYRFHHPYHSRIDFRSLKNWARREAVRLFSPPRACFHRCAPVSTAKLVSAAAPVSIAAPAPSPCSILKA